MDLLLTRQDKTNLSTIGALTIDGKLQCYMLEDKDRGLYKDMPMPQLMRIKVHGETAIPTGKYEVIISWSNRFKRRLPLLLNVPGFTGVRIHSGNKPEDTEGCPLTGLVKTKDSVSQSRIAFNALFNKIDATLKKEKVYIIIV